ncbi:MAG: S9 family peptidase [Chloroflexaceae bacterium]|jgi:dipeptidyl aminopeptidase/acylaminoacyl peptidase|nr:S9 family peptidase [Chloroflexaceae bacterium]
MPDATPTLDQMLAIGGLGTGPYGGGDVVRWSPDGTQLLVYAGLGGEGALWLVPRAGGFPRRVTVAPIGLPFLASPQQSWSPDGRCIAYLSEHQGATELWLWDAASGQQRPLTRLGNSIASYAWEPHGQSLLLASNQQGTYDIYRVGLADGVATRLTTDRRYEVSPAPTPDGRYILYVRLDERWADHEVVRMDSDGGNPTVIARDEDFFDYHYGRTFGPPLISPDSSQLLFRSHRSGWINYWSVPLAGGDPRPLAPQEADQSGATWSPDGRRVAFIANHNGTLALWLCDMASGAARPLVQPDMAVCTAPAWSPDGRTLAFFMAGPTETHDLWLVEVASGTCQRLTDSMPAGGLRELLARPEKIIYRSFDDLPISAYLYRPNPHTAGPRCPAVLLIHGGPTMQFLDSYDSLAQFLCSQGYAVLLPNIRGSSGYGKKFEDLNNGDWGHGDLRDAIAGADWLRAQDWIDGAHIGITGTSYGGCLSMAAVCNAPGQFQAAAPHAGYADWLHVMDEQERRHLQLMHYEFGPFPEQAATYRRCSPIFNARQASTPTLVLHGAGQLPQSDASRRFVEALRREYKTVEYKVYPNECYYVRSKANLKQMYLDIANFFDRYLR